MLITWLETLAASFGSLWGGFIVLLPKLLAAFVVLVLGWALAAIIGRLVGRIIRVLWIEKAIEKLKIKDAFSKMGFKLDFAGLIGWLVKWFLILVVFIAAADILGLSQITVFLNSVVFYIPNVIIAVVIILLGVLIGAFTGEVTQKTVKASGLHSGEVIGGLTKWSIIVFSFMAALIQLGIATAMIQTLFTGLIAMLAIAGGLAFGLGGRDMAEDVLGHFKQDLTKGRK